MEELFVVLIPTEYINQTILRKLDDAPKRTKSMGDAEADSKGLSIPVEAPADAKSEGEAPLDTVQQPFRHERLDENGNKQTVLNVYEMVIHVIKGYVKDFTATSSVDGMTVQIIFPIGSKSHSLFQRLRSIGVGIHFGSISSIPLLASSAVAESVDFASSKFGAGPSLKLRKTIEQLRLQSKFTFDMAILSIVASIIAAVGLATNNAVIVVASMLVSPLMGPILGISFGTMIFDIELLKRGIITEIYALFLCVFVGFVVGLPFAVNSEALDWETFEMSSRGEPIGLVFGLCVAIPSGVGVAMSILENNTTSLVGVAISASLLPPAVNTGLLLAYLCVAEDDHMNIFVQSVISFALTMINIICIYFASIVWFRIKEVTPMEHRSDTWKSFIEEVNLQRTLKGTDAEEMRKQLMQQLYLIRQRSNGEIMVSDSKPGQISKAKGKQSVSRPNFLGIPGGVSTKSRKDIKAAATTSSLQDLFIPPTPTRDVSLASDPNEARRYSTVHGRRLNLHRQNTL